MGSLQNDEYFMVASVEMKLLKLFEILIEHDHFIIMRLRTYVFNLLLL